MVRRCGPRVERLARRLLGGDAEDGLQEVFAAACAALPGFRQESRLTTWFHRVAVRVLCRFRERRDRQRGIEVTTGDLDARLPDRTLAAWSASPFEHVAAGELRQRVVAAVESLSPPLREVLMLRLEHLAYADLAEALGIPLGTVKSRMAAALVQLAALLQSEDPR